MPFCLESKFCYLTIFNSQVTKFLDHINLELYGNDNLCSFVISVLSTGSECQSIGFSVPVSHTCASLQYYVATYY